MPALSKRPAASHPPRPRGDHRVFRGSGLHDKALSVERIRAATAAIDESAEGIVLVARTETLLLEPDALGEAIDKLVAFAEAGAACP